MGRHWSQTAGGCIRSTPEQSRRPPPSACGSRRCVEGRCRRCRPLDSCAPRAVRSTQLSTLRPREHAPANLAAAATMESCAMTLRGCPSLGTRSPVQASVPGELSAAVPQRRVLMRPTLAWDQWQRPGCRRHHRGVVRSPWDTRTRWLFYYVKEVVQLATGAHFGNYTHRYAQPGSRRVCCQWLRSGRHPPCDRSARAQDGCAKQVPRHDAHGATHEFSLLGTRLPYKPLRF